MATARIGALNVQLGLDSAQFTSGLTKAQAQLKTAGQGLQATGAKMAGVGAIISVGLTAPIIAFGSAATKAATESRQALGQVESALKSMGAASGKTAPELQKAAAQLQRMSTFDDDDILRKVTANMLTFGNVSGQAFDRAQQAAVNLSARLGQDLQASAIQVGKALNDPVKGITALARVGVSFTAQQKEQIKAMVQVGDLAGAQGIILGELEHQFGGAAKALRDATPGADTQEAWRTFQETIGEIALKVLPPLTSLLADLLNAFNTLDPGVQTFVVGAVGIAAAAGPVLTAIGGLTTAVGVLLPVLAGAATFLTATLIPAAIATAPVWGPIALAVGAVGLAIAGLIKWWPQIKAFAINVATAFVDLHVRALEAAKKLAEGVKTWLQDKLGAVLKWVEDKAKAVGDAFFKLYDRVVGHSYVPDLIKGIQTWFAKLSGVMVAPATAANDQVAESFEQMSGRVSGGVDRMFAAIKNRDWQGAASGITAAFQGIDAATKQYGIAGGVGAAAGAIAPYVGGTAGSTLSGIAAGAQLGSIIPGIGTAIGAVVGGIAGLLGGILKPKASNNGAGVQINADKSLMFTGNKATDETTAAAKAAAQGVLAGMDVLKQAGITLTNTVHSIVIGTRDASQITLSNGKMLTAAVGDAAAAAEAGLKGVLEGATYVSDIQKSLVESMVAAGKGFDDIAAALSNFAAAQGFQKQIADAILELTDPNAFALQQLKENQDARRAQIQAALDAGYLSGDQFASLTTELAKLDSLELDKTLKGFADAADAAANANRGQADAASSATDEWDSIRQRLADFRLSLTGSAGGANPQQALAAAQAEFIKTATAAWSGDQTAAGNLADVSQTFLDALRAGASDATQFARGVNAIKAATAPGIGTTANGAFSGNSLLSEVSRQGYALAAIATQTRKTAAEIFRQGRDGLYVRGAAPGDPVSTAA